MIDYRCPANDENSVWRTRRLSDEQRAIVAAFIESCPTPERLLRIGFPRMYRLALSLFDIDEVRSLAMEGAIRAAHQYDPDRGGRFVTVAVFHVRSGKGRDPSETAVAS